MLSPRLPSGTTRRGCSASASSLSQAGSHAPISQASRHRRFGFAWSRDPSARRGSPTGFCDRDPPGRIRRQTARTLPRPARSRVRQEDGPLSIAIRRCRLMADCAVNLYGRHEKSIGQVKPRGTLQSFTMEFKAAAIPPTHVEGYNQGEWILIDYVDFVVHVFSEKARKFYDLERLWKSAKRLQPAELKPLAVRRQRSAATVARRKRA